MPATAIVHIWYDGQTVRGLLERSAEEVAKHLTGLIYQRLGGGGHPEYERKTYVLVSGDDVLKARASIPQTMTPLS